MQIDKIKGEALAVWATVLGWFSFLPKPEARGAAAVTVFVLLFLIAPLLWFLAVAGAGVWILVRASKA